MGHGGHMGKRTFKVVLIKPSHYDAEGYVIQWWRSTIPSNSLASVYGLLDGCAQDHVLGPDVDIEIDAYDECNTIVDVKTTIREITAAGSGFVGLVGVQSNQFPRALDLGRRFRAANLPVGHRRVPCQRLHRYAARFAGRPSGRARPRHHAVRRRRRRSHDGTPACINGGAAKPIYNYLGDLPDMAAAALPVLPRRIVTRVAGHYASFDAGRGCPFQCSFCTIINVQGRKSRYRTPDDVEAIVRVNAAQGVTRFFVTDDNFARNRNWEPILDRLIMLRDQGLKIRLILQVDTLCHRVPGFIEKAARAGCNAVFIGLENINPESLMGTKKRQNKIWEYREMLHAWRDAQVMTWAGYILGFPTDTPESIARDIEIIKRELPIDILEFFCLTPLPGSEDHKNLHARRVQMDPDMNKYDLEHVCTAHPIMSKETWTQVYRDAWSRYYTDAHVETILRRAVASGLSPKKIVDALTVFSGATWIEGVHPLQFGFVRRKIRTQRRHGLRLESPLVFYPRRAVEFATAALRWIRLMRRYRMIMRKVVADAASRTYTDEALVVATHSEEAVCDFVQTFADKIPKTYGAPPRRVAVR